MRGARFNGRKPRSVDIMSTTLASRQHKSLIEVGTKEVNPTLEACGAEALAATGEPFLRFVGAHKTYAGGEMIVQQRQCAIGAAKLVDRCPTARSPTRDPAASAELRRG